MVGSLFRVIVTEYRCCLQVRLWRPLAHLTGGYILCFAAPCPGCTLEDMGIRLTPALSSVLLCAALGTALPAGAQMYKWVDERGQVSYSNTPPPDSSKKKVEAVAERVSVYTPDAEISKAMSANARRDAKISALERALEAERNARGTPAASRPDMAARRQAAYERCIAERRVDCEAIRTGAASPDATFGYTGYYPQFVIGLRGPFHQQPFFVDPTPPPRIGVSTAPKVGIDDRPPVGAPPRSHTVGQFR